MNKIKSFSISILASLAYWSLVNMFFFEIELYKWLLIEMTYGFVEAFVEKIKEKLNLET